MCLSPRLRRLCPWLLDRMKAAWNTFVENIITYLIGILVLILITSIGTAVGIRLDIIDTPQWWPWRAAPRTAEVHLTPLTLPDGTPGYAFARSAFSEARRKLGGRGSLKYGRPELENLRVCQDILFPPQNTSHELIQMIKDKLDPCLELDEEKEGKYRRYVFNWGTNGRTKIVQRANRGESELVYQLFCKCNTEQIDQFLKHHHLP